MKFCYDQILCGKLKLSSSDTLTVGMCCSRCNIPLSGNEIFCPQCGRKLRRLSREVMIGDLLAAWSDGFDADPRCKEPSSPSPECEGEHGGMYGDCSGWMFENVCEGCGIRGSASSPDPGMCRCRHGKGYRTSMDAFGCDSYENGFCTASILLSNPPKYQRCSLCGSGAEYIDCDKLRISREQAKRDDF